MAHVILHTSYGTPVGDVYAGPQVLRCDVDLSAVIAVEVGRRLQHLPVEKPKTLPPLVNRCLHSPLFRRCSLPCHPLAPLLVVRT